MSSYTMTDVFSKPAKRSHLPPLFLAAALLLLSAPTWGSRWMWLPHRPVLVAAAAARSALLPATWATSSAELAAPPLLDSLPPAESTVEGRAALKSGGGGRGGGAVAVGEHAAYLGNWTFPPKAAFSAAVAPPEASIIPPAASILVGTPRVLGQQPKQQLRGEASQAASQPVRSNATAGAAAAHARAPFSGKLGGNPVYAAYSTMLGRLLLAPAHQRRYVIVKPLSGWGNKIRVVATGLQLALALDRILVLSTELMQPFYGHVFSTPFSPWLTHGVEGLPSTNIQHIVLKAPHKRNSAMLCWAAKQALSQCVDTSARVVSFEGYFNGDLYIRRDAALRASLVARLAPFVSELDLRRGQGGLPKRATVDHYASRTLLPQPRKALGDTLYRTKTALQWDKYKLHVGVHMRVFVDYWRRRVSVSNISPAFWACIIQHVTALQAARNVTARDTLIYAASDLPAARPASKQHLASLGTVRWFSGTHGFQHSEAKRDVQALASVMTDWWMLSETDLVVGTDLSTFGPTAAVHGGVPLLVASMKRGRGGAAGKCDLVRKPDYGTVN